MKAFSLALGALFLLGLAPLRAITFAQVDTFEDEGTAQWEEGGISPNPPTNVASGGPAGAGDHYLANVSSGTGNAGSRMIMYNFGQWTGNYAAAGIDRITAQMVNFGPAPLAMRVALRSASYTSFCSTQAIQLPPDGVWRAVTFDLTSGSMTNIAGSNTLAQVLANVAEVRILSAADAPAFIGDSIAATLGMDNLLARDIAGFVFRITGVATLSGTAQISFTTVAGGAHRVERGTSLPTNDWVPVPGATSVTGTGGVVQVSDTDPAAASLPVRYYRVLLLP